MAAVQRMQQRLVDAADLQLRAADALGLALQATAEALVTSLSAGGRVWLHGFGAARWLAEHAASTMRGRFERDRPGLAALALPVDVPRGIDLLRAIDTWTHPGDLVWLLSCDAHDADAVRGALDAVHQRESTAVVWAAAGTTLHDALHDTDLLLPLPGARAPVVLELALAGLHAVLESVDLQLLGDDEAAADDA